MNSSPSAGAGGPASRQRRDHRRNRRSSSTTSSLRCAISASDIKMPATPWTVWKAIRDAKPRWGPRTDRPGSVVW